MTHRGVASLVMGVMALGWLGYAYGAERRDEARLGGATARCTTQADLVACGEALNLKPNDPDLLVAEADALVRLKRPGEAIGVYRNALTVGASHAGVEPKIAQAATLRQTLLATCLNQTGEGVRRACESAWLPGAVDEVTLFKRRAMLLEADQQPAAALDLYLAAARLKPTDRSVARAVVNLSASTGRRDAASLAAIGSAQLTLGHPAEAVAALRQALRLAPDLVSAKRRLRVAERNVREQTAAVPVARAAPESSADAAPVTFSNEAPATRTN